MNSVAQIGPERIVYVSLQSRDTGQGPEVF